MNYTSIIFSPTGGTQKVLDAFSARWGDASGVIDLTELDADFSTMSIKTDAAIIAVPSFGGRMPELASTRLAQVKGNAAKAVIVCVYGNRDFEDTLVEIQDVAEKAGFDVVAGVSAIAEHSIMHQFATGRPDASDCAALEEIAADVLKVIEGGNGVNPPIPGNRPYKKAASTPLYPSTSKSCTKCMLCVAKCPSGALDKADPSKLDKDKCISCMRCVSICPEQAKSVNGLMVKVAAMAIRKACSVRKDPFLYI